MIMAKSLPSISLITCVLFSSVQSPTARADDWPPHETGDGKLAAPITRSSAESLRRLTSFAALEGVMGNKGHLEAVEEKSDGEPRALYVWSGAGGKGTIRAYRYRSGSFGAIV